MNALGNKSVGPLYMNPRPSSSILSIFDEDEVIVVAAKAFADSTFFAGMNQFLHSKGVSYSCHQGMIPSCNDCSIAVLCRKIKKSKHSNVSVSLTAKN